MTNELPAYGFWHKEREDVPHKPPSDLSPLASRVFIALQLAFLTERAHSGVYVSFLNAPIVSLDGKFRVDEMARHIADTLNNPPTD